jgi:hypothetical protein
MEPEHVFQPLKIADINSKNTQINPNHIVTVKFLNVFFLSMPKSLQEQLKFLKME